MTISKAASGMSFAVDEEDYMGGNFLGEHKKSNFSEFISQSLREKNPTSRSQNVIRQDSLSNIKVKYESLPRITHPTAPVKGKSRHKLSGMNSLSLRN